MASPKIMEYVINVGKSRICCWQVFDWAWGLRLGNLTAPKFGLLTLSANSDQEI